MITNPSSISTFSNQFTMTFKAINIYEVIRPLECFLKVFGIIPIFSHNNRSVQRKLLNVSVFVVNIVIGTTIAYLLSQHFQSILNNYNITDFNSLFVYNQYYQMIILGVPLIPVVTNFVLAKQDKKIFHNLHKTGSMVSFQNFKTYVLI